MCKAIEDMRKEERMETSIETTKKNAQRWAVVLRENSRIYRTIT